MKKVKKISKYILNSLNMINAILIGIAPIWGLNLSKVIDTIVVITAIISTYLIGGKLFTLKGDEEDGSENIQ